tara:strand:+ start:1413 stop:1676 length:264 start_codon:yes stop_codon:yes gene_type:complete
MKMIRLKEYIEITEGRSPMWVKGLVGGMVLQIRQLHSKIMLEKDPTKQNKLISQQNKLISYISGLGIGFSSNNRNVQQQMRQFSRRR